MVLFVQYQQATEHNLNISLIKQRFLAALKGMERYATGKSSRHKKKRKQIKVDMMSSTLITSYKNVI